MRPSPVQQFGRFPFPGVPVYLHRLAQIERRFMASARFSSYITLTTGQNIYGLSGDELAPALFEAGDTLMGISSSCIGPEGRSVNVTVRLGGSAQAMCQFAVSTPFRFEAHETRDILLGIWQPLSEEREWRDMLLGEILENVVHHKLRRLDQLRVVHTPRPISVPVQVQDTFYIREPLDAELLATLSDHLVSEYLDGLPLLIRIVLADGTPRTARSSSDLPALLTSLGNRVAKLVLSAQGPAPQRIEIAFSLGVLARGAPVCTLDFHHPAAQEIQALLRASLEIPSRIVSPYTTLYQETFQFDQSAMTPGLLAQALDAVSARYLNHQPFTAVVTTLTGSYFSEVPTYRLASVFQENSGLIHFVQFTAQRLIGGQSCSISCYFQPTAAAAIGTLSLLWGASDQQAELARFLRDQLQLSIITQPLLQAHTPLPKQRRLSCMILMPPDAYWSEGIWNHLQSLLQESGWDAYRPAPLYDAYSLLELQDHIQAVSWVLADVTYRHPHTMYGLGLAHALSKNTLVLSQQIRDIPPDMKALPYLVYENSIPGLLALTERFIALTRKA